MRHSYMNAVAGACLALGLRFAGSSDAAAYELLSGKVAYFHALRLSPSPSARAPISFSTRPPL